MSTSQNILLWKEKSEIDYIPLFISLWLSFNAWIKWRFELKKDRDLINLCKRSDTDLSDRFSRLMSGSDAAAYKFKADIAKLHRALINANIPYEMQNDASVSFEKCIIEWNDGRPDFESVLKKKGQKGIVKMDDNLWFLKDSERLFAAYIEIVYQIRCSLFHGNLTPVEENEDVIKQLYLTLSMIMEGVET